MAYQALYRRLRPNTFAEVLGQKDIVRTLKNQVKNNQIAHAYLFCGTRGTGKTSLAKILASAVNCFNPNDAEPCLECNSCLSLKDGNNMDVLELDAASRNGVDDMRELLDQVNYPPQVGKYKVYIIDEVHMLSTAAFNALLKTLEEPPAHLIFILATTEPQKIPATILSRCQRFDLSRISTDTIYESMQKVLKNLKIDFENEAVRTIAISADGSVRDGWSILDICITGMDSSGKLTVQHVQNMLGTADKTFMFNFSKAMLERNYSAVIELIDKLMKDGKEPLVFLRQLSAHFRNIMLIKITNDKSIDEMISDEEFKKLVVLGNSSSEENILSIIEKLMEAEAKLKWSSSPRIGFETAVLGAMYPKSNTVVNGNDNQVISELENKISKLESLITSGQFVSSNNSQNKNEFDDSKKSTVKKDKKPDAPIAKNIDTSNAASLMKEALAIAKKDITYFIFLNGSNLSINGNRYLISVPHNKLQSFHRLSEQENYGKTKKLFENLVGKEIELKIELEKDPQELQNTMDSEKSMQSLLASLPREMIEINTGEQWKQITKTPMVKTLYLMKTC